MTDYETILVDREGRVGIITLNRPKALNALNTQVMNEVTTAAAELDNDPRHRGDHHHRQREAFAAGADIKEMRACRSPTSISADFFAAVGDRSPPPANRPSPRSRDTRSAAGASWR